MRAGGPPARNGWTPTGAQRLAIVMLVATIPLIVVLAVWGPATWGWWGNLVSLGAIVLWMYVMAVLGRRGPMPPR